MGYSLRMFVASDDGLSKVPMTQMFAAYARRIKHPKSAHSDPNAREVRVLEAVVELDGRRPIRVLSVLPHRVLLDGEGFTDEGANRRRSRDRVVRALHCDAGAKRSHVEGLMDDANYFWPLNEHHWTSLAKWLGLPLEHVRRARDVSTS